MTEIHALAGLVARLLDRIDAGGALEAFDEPIERGSASGSLSLLADQDDAGAHVLQVRLRIMRVPEQARETFFARLLELNHGFQGRAAFSVDGAGIAWLTSAYPVAHLDASDVIDLLLWTAEQADHYDDVLLSEFGHEHRV